MSSHIYARHYSMVRSIVAAGDDHYEAIPMPWCSDASEAMAIISSRGKNTVEIDSDIDQPLLAWIMKNE